MPLHWPVLPIALVCTAAVAQPVVYDFTFMGRLDDEYFNPYNWYPLSVPNNTPEYECRVFLQAAATINPQRTVVLHSFFGDHYLRLENASLTIEHELASGSLSVRDGSSVTHLGVSPIVVDSWQTYDTGFSSSNTTEIIGRFQSPSLGASGQAVALFPNVTRIANAPGTQSPSNAPYLTALIDWTSLVQSRLSLPSLTEWPDGLTISMRGGRIELDSITTLDRVTLNYSSKGELGELYAPLLSELGGSQFNVWAPDVSFLAPSQSSGFEIDVHSGGIAFPGLERITGGMLEMTVNSNRTFYTANASFPDLDHTTGDSGVLRVKARGFGDDEKVEIRFGSLTQIPPYSDFHAVGNDTHFDLPSVTVAESVQINDGIGNNQTTLGPLTSINNSSIRLGTFGEVSHPLTELHATTGHMRLEYRNADVLRLPALTRISSNEKIVSISSGGDLHLPLLTTIASGRDVSLIAGGSLQVPSLTQFPLGEPLIPGDDPLLTLGAGSGGAIHLPPHATLESINIYLSDGAVLDVPTLDTLIGCEINLTHSQLTTLPLETIRETHLNLNGPEEGSGEDPFMFGAGVSPVFERATIDCWGDSGLGYSTLRGSAFIRFRPDLTNLRRFEPIAYGDEHSPIYLYVNDYSPDEWDLTSLEEIPAGVQLRIESDVRISGTVRTGMLGGWGGRFLFEGDVLPEHEHKSNTAHNTVNRVTFAFVGKGRQRFEVFTSESRPGGLPERARLVIGNGVDPLDVLMQNEYNNHYYLSFDVLQLASSSGYPGLQIQHGARLILGDTGSAARLDEEYDGTYVTLESLIPPGQNCVEYDRGLLCRQRCTSDTNRDGLTDFGDIQAFIDLYLAGDLAADFNNDGLLDSGDFVAFVDAFLLGC